LSEGDSCIVKLSLLLKNLGIVRKNRRASFLFVSTSFQFENISYFGAGYFSNGYCPNEFRASVTSEMIMK
jgi:hypothetical protein